MGSSSELDNQLYPTVIDVSFGMTVIENHNIVTGRNPDVKVIRYNFDGMDNYTVSMKMEGLDKKDEEKVSKDTKVAIMNPPKITNVDVDEIEVIEENSDSVIPKGKQ